MSERDSVHKEIEKFQEEIKEKNKKLAAQEGRHKHHEDEVSVLTGSVANAVQGLTKSSGNNTIPPFSKFYLFLYI